jgi:hypothetical protein
MGRAEQGMSFFGDGLVSSVFLGHCVLGLHWESCYTWIRIAECLVFSLISTRTCRLVIYPYLTCKKQRMTLPQLLMSFPKHGLNGVLSDTYPRP